MPSSGGHQEKARMPGPPGFWFSIAISRLREIPLINRCVSYFYIIVTRVVGHSLSLPQQRTCVEEFMKAHKQQRPQPTSREGIVFKGPNDLTSVTRTQLLRAPQLLKQHKLGTRIHTHKPVGDISDSNHSILPIALIS